MIVRRGGEADLAALVQLREMDADQAGLFGEWMAGHAASHLPFVAELGGQVVGAAWLHVAERVPSSGSTERHYGDVQSVMVFDQYRGRGVGSALLAAILTEARARGLQHVTVHSGRRAVEFYVRNGFTHHRQNLLWEP